MRRLYLKFVLWRAGYCTKHYRRKDECHGCYLDSEDRKVKDFRARSMAVEAENQRRRRNIQELQELDARR